MPDDSHEISYLLFFRKLGKISLNLSFAVVVIGTLRVKYLIRSQDSKSVIKKKLYSYIVFFNQNICCGYSKEPSQGDSSLEDQKHMIITDG